MAAPRVDVVAGDRTVSVSSPDKPYFPQLGEAGRKLAVVRYHAEVAPALLRAVGHRPTYLQRYPDGLDGDEVFQKRLPRTAPSELLRTTVTFPSGRTAEVLVPVHPADLVWAAQQGTLTFHPWPVRADDQRHPDLLRLDLDPQPGTDFDDARRVALEVLRPLLDELGLVGFPKTSGSRGLHVDVPLEPVWSFGEARRSVLALAREMERRAPDQVTSAWWKEERGARVFIDFNQMLPDRTIAAAYSIRARPAATVSTPVTWEELPEVDPSAFTVQTVPQRLAERGDPQADLALSRGRLDTLLEWVSRDAGRGQGEAPYPPNFPKVPGEPPRVQPSRARSSQQGASTDG